MWISNFQIMLLHVMLERHHTQLIGGSELPTIRAFLGFLGALCM